MRWRTFLILLGALLLPFGCTSEEKPAATLVVGLVDVSEGSRAYLNDMLSINTKLALARHSSNGTIYQGKTPVHVQFITLPMTDKADSPRQTVAEAIHTYGAQVILGGAHSKTALSMSNVAEELRIPFLTPTATAKAVTEDKTYTFATSPSVPAQAKSIAAFLRHTLQAKRVGILADSTDPFTRSLAESLKTDYSAQGGLITSLRTYSKPEELESGLAALAQESPDVIYLSSMTPSLFEQGIMLEKLGYSNSIMGPESRQLYMYKSSRQQPRMPVYILTNWNREDDSPANKEFVQGFRAATGNDPTEYDAFTYDTMLRLLEAVENAKGVTPQDITDALAAQPLLSGAVGKYDFRSEMVLNTIWSLAIHDGKLITQPVQMPKTESPKDTPHVIPEDKH